LSELCRHFGECGGCQWQDVPYPGQLTRKSEALRALFADDWAAPIPVEASPQVWHYRNKVDFGFGRKRYPEPPPPGFERESVLGFKAKGRWYWPLDIHECRIGPEGLAALLAAVRAWMHGQGLHAFDSRSKQGFLKVLLVREGQRTGQRMVVLITGDGDFDKASFVEVVQNAFPAASIYRGIFRGSADVASAHELELLDGAPAIEERLEIPAESRTRDLRFRLSPLSFFQTNTLAAEKLYAAIRAWVAEVGPQVLYDLYGGAGGIALTCADLVQHVWSVENVVAASQDGRANARMNGIANVAFVPLKVEKYLRVLRDEGPFEPGVAVVVDPPRSGMPPKAVRRLVELAPRRILYVSCKPAQFITELPAFREAYDIADIKAFDLFPHTEHIETLISLTRTTRPRQTP